jgi:hypothetical protein
METIMPNAVQASHLGALSARPRVHFTLQGKGGVGKSFVSALVAQYLHHCGITVQCIDTDPVNDTLTQYRALKAQHLELMRDGRVDERAFDELMQRLLTEPGSFIVDSGATSFVALTNYLVENHAFEMLRDLGREVVVHSVVTGGQACRDTIVGFKFIAGRAAPGSVVVWLNEYFGPIEVQFQAGTSFSRKNFTEMKVYEDHREAVLGIISLPRRNPDTFGRDIQEMATQKLTFQEVSQSERWSIMARSRLAVVERELYAQLQVVLG